MSISYGFFNAVNNDRTYNADDFNDYFNGILSSNGVYKTSGNGLEVTAGTGMTVNITTGRCRIQDHYLAVTSAESVELTPASMTLNRYDAIVLRYDEDARTVTPTVITGTAASSPTKPSVTRTTSVYDMCLAYVYVAANSSSISALDIEDTRADEYLCGYVEIEVDAVDVGISQLSNVVTVAEATTSVNVGISTFDSANDILQITNNGFVLVPSVDYTLSGTGSSAAATFVHTINAGSVLEFKVTKVTVEVLG